MRASQQSFSIKEVLNPIVTPTSANAAHSIENKYAIRNFESKDKFRSFAPPEKKSSRDSINSFQISLLNAPLTERAAIDQMTFAGS